MPSNECNYFKDLLKKIYSLIKEIMNFQMSVKKRNAKECHMENKLVIAKMGGVVGVGWTGNLRLIDANYCLWSG